MSEGLALALVCTAPVWVFGALVVLIFWRGAKIRKQNYDEYQKRRNKPV